MTRFLTRQPCPTPGCRGLHGVALASRSATHHSPDSASGGARAGVPGGPQNEVPDRPASRGDRELPLGVGEELGLRETPDHAFSRRGGVAPLRPRGSITRRAHPRPAVAGVGLDLSGAGD